MTGRAMPRLERKEQFWGKLPAFPEGIVKPWPFSVANAAKDPAARGHPRHHDDPRHRRMVLND
jgi:hypothetical protein